MVVAGELTQEQTALLFAHLPIGIGFSVADEGGVVRFWAGEGFSSCSPKLIGRSLFDGHPKRARPAIESLLADLKSGRKDEVDTIEHGKDGSERIIYTALRNADGAYRGVLETVVPIDSMGSPDDGVGAADQRPFAVSHPCPVCDGQGAINEQPCATCHGTGVQRFFHGTKADLKPGDPIKPGHRPNFGKQDRVTNYVYLTGTLDAAVWGAELALGEGPGRIYIVEPTGPIEDDPNLTDRRYPGNPTKSYRSREPLRVTGEVTDWQGHSPEALKAMKDGIERAKRQGIEPIDD